MKRYLFFLRHFNDIDNIAPAIYFFLEVSDEHRADVVLYQEQYDFRNDPNLRFLESRFGNQFSVQWLGESFGIGVDKANRKRKAKKDRLNFVMRIGKKVGMPMDSILSGYKSVKKTLKGYFDSKTQSVKSLSMSDIRRGEVGKELIQTGLLKIINEPVQPSLVIFDTNRTGGVKGLVENMKELNVKNIICLPVSPLINYNVLRSEYFVDVFSERFRKGHDYSGFDAMGVVDNHYVDSYNRFLPLVGLQSDLKNKTTKLGSVRFCPEWIQIRESMIDKYKGPSESKSKKIVFFLSHAASNVNMDEVQRTITILSLFRDYTVVVKGHTREDKQNYFGKYSNIQFENDIDSTALINWADLVLFWSTSVAIEGYIKNKFMVCLSYIVGNKNLYEKYDAGFIALCRDDLIEVLLKYKEGMNLTEYNREGCQRFLKEVVWSNESEVTVPEAYLSFMRKFETKESELN